MRRVQRVVLRNNQAYIASAGQADASRTEPPFRLQGSYRNMNKLAERIVPVMNDAELEAVDRRPLPGRGADPDHRRRGQPAQAGRAARPADARSRPQRWAEVKAAYLREQALGGAEDDPMTRAVGAVGLLADRVGDVEKAIGRLGQS